MPIFFNYDSFILSSTHIGCTSRGNIHTGATPPWLLGDDEDEEEGERDDSVVILKNPAGPSEEDFEHWSKLI